MSGTPFFTVQIINYNAGAYLQNAIDSLAAQSFRDFEVILIDNDSTDGSLDALNVSDLEDCRIEPLGRNSGFAEGNNIAAKMARGEWIVLLNADAAASPDWLSVLKETIEAYPDCSMFASVQYSMDDPDMLDGAGDGYTAWGFAWRGAYRHPATVLPDFGETFAPCGASAAYRRQTFLDHGGFDERYFCFMEDVDLAFRMRLGGEICLFQPKAIIEHKGGGMSGEKSEFAVFHGARNRVWTYFGNMPTLLMLVTLPGFLFLTSYLIIWYSGRPYGKYVWNGTKAGFSDALKIRRERKGCRTTGRKVSLLKLARAFHWNPFPMSRHDVAVREFRSHQSDD